MLYLSPPLGQTSGSFKNILSKTMTQGELGLWFIGAVIFFLSLFSVLFLVLQEPLQPTNPSPLALP